MSANVSLKEMSVADKLDLLEELWDDLSASPEKVSSPLWHKEILDERQARVEAGEEQFEDWETAKQELLRRIS